MTILKITKRFLISTVKVNRLHFCNVKDEWPIFKFLDLMFESDDVIRNNSSLIKDLELRFG